MPKVAFFTLGCKVNQADSAAMQSLFTGAGYEIVDFSAAADVYVINTCVVTNVAQNKSKQMIRRAVRQNPNALIAVSGCLPQTAAGEVTKIDGVHLIIGNDRRLEIVELVERARLSGYVDAVNSFSRDTAFEEMLSGNIENRTRAYLKIEEGCNQYCSYCIIPYARGFVRSRSLESIKSETARLVAEGFREIVLIGIHLGAYGAETSYQVRLYDALQAALSVKGLERLRLGSLESIELEDRLITLMAEDRRLCRHLHLPLQSGSDAILKAMNRPYKTADFMQLLKKLRSKIPDIAVTTDVIVGFPGESTQLFEETRDFAQKAGFSKVHIFPFSARKGTPAATMTGQVSNDEKHKRVKLLSEIAEKSSFTFSGEMIGKTFPVLFEEETSGGHIGGLTDNYVRVLVKGDRSLLGTIKDVVIEKADKENVYGNLK